VPSPKDSSGPLPVFDDWLTATSLFGRIWILVANPFQPILKEMLIRKSFQRLELLFRMFGSSGIKRLLGHVFNNKNL
jgi:hypothetical protein